jgi:hypothetical protein
MNRLYAVFWGWFSRFYTGSERRKMKRLGHSAGNIHIPLKEEGVIRAFFNVKLTADIPRQARTR